MDDETKIYKRKVLRDIKNEIKSGKKILDVGCGDCSDDIFFTDWGLTVYGMDIYTHKNVKKVLGRKFIQGNILKIPFKTKSFDYVFSHVVFHHIDEVNQSTKRHIQGLNEMKRVCKKGGKVFILEANRYNPLFFPHMVLLKKHNHFTQPYFIKLNHQVFIKPKFIFLEEHVYPVYFYWLFKIYEKIMDQISFLRPLRAYNLMIANI